MRSQFHSIRTSHLEDIYLIYIRALFLNFILSVHISEDKIVMKLNRFDKLVAKSYLISCASTGIGFVGINFYNNFFSGLNSSQREMPMKSS